MRFAHDDLGRVFAPQERHEARGDLCALQDLPRPAELARQTLEFVQRDQFCTFIGSRFHVHHDQVCLESLRDASASTDQSRVPRFGAHGDRDALTDASPEDFLGTARFLFDDIRRVTQRQFAQYRQIF